MGVNMKTTEFKIGNQIYTLINTISYEGKTYIAYSSDDDCIYLGEYSLNNNQMEIKGIPDDLFDKVKELLMNE